MGARADNRIILIRSDHHRKIHLLGNRRRQTVRVVPERDIEHYGIAGAWRAARRGPLTAGDWDQLWIELGNKVLPLPWTAD